LPLHYIDLFSFFHYYFDISPFISLSLLIDTDAPTFLASCLPNISAEAFATDTLIISSSSIDTLLLPPHSRQR
jgi:hypothetical protein